MFSVHNSVLLAVVGISEMFKVTQGYRNVVKDVSLISITDPNSTKLDSNITNKYKNVLEISFYDVEEEICGYKPISDDEAKTILGFIRNNKDNIFCVHCAAGQSRSAGVAKAIECITLFNGDMYLYNTSTFEDSIRNHARYSPNNYVFRSIIKQYNEGE